MALGLNDIFNTGRWIATPLSHSEHYRKRMSRELRLNKKRNPWNCVFYCIKIDIIDHSIEGTEDAGFIMLLRLILTVKDLLLIESPDTGIKAITVDVQC
ncbi:hypothetical protein ACFOTA_17865 [Chitinophaga sp. GCM10012297]|uniref:Uncharacterized protein n=1 Tax=Chitinophaga chungangae TaxID=2821488 RepID=A0ABS3YJ10_9BACT|nr:hypothetical protein [Chitinophaga chungangae]MBO9154089.1 hypothetical protein [Chitinophaga chungangae]